MELTSHGDWGTLDGHLNWRMLDCIIYFQFFFFSALLLLGEIHRTFHHTDSRIHHKTNSDQ